eukprot:Gregarina_sp_Poly_1__6777@NODE_365_length_9176_cov_254_590076_g301_i0_p5_GENE_NODE_365_length_9176_cov_254_590076_g301_i0NODE_365_length_9176_cov_254_590076_g301_i0_p5_ORF_typecomplete_len126_score5_32_NODE_365_length_9176_cov_254_590076_g301_i031193496
MDPIWLNDTFRLSRPLCLSCRKVEYSLGDALNVEFSDESSRQQPYAQVSQTTGFRTHHQHNHRTAAVGLTSSAHSFAILVCLGVVVAESIFLLLAWRKFGKKVVTFYANEWEWLQSRGFVNDGDT